MKITREQKILAGVLGLAGVALLVDRVFLLDATGSPRDAIGAPVEPDPGDAPSPGLPESPARELEQAGKELERRFDAIAESRGLTPGEIDDAFSSDAEWAAFPMVEKKVEDTPVRERTIEQRITAFRLRHRLTAVMHTGDADWAVINGDLYAPGRTIGECTLVEVRSDAAVFRLGSRTFELRLPGPSDGAPEPE